jgi:hypothetical protein
MKRLLFNLLVLSIILNLTSCEERLRPNDNYVDKGMYVYIAGDSGKKVQISYLESLEKVSKDMPDDGSPAPESIKDNKNVITTDSVTLPFFKEIYFLGKADSEEGDAFLEIFSENDSTTKAIIFDNRLLLENSVCGILNAWETGGLYLPNCSYCSEMLACLKKANYPCYLEFSKGDTQKKVMMRGYRDWIEKN